MSLKSWLYKRAVAYIGKCNQEWERPNVRHDLQNLDRLTYRNCDKAYLLYGSDAEWSKFSRYEVLDNAIQKLAMYEDRKELMPTKRRRLTMEDWSKKEPKFRYMLLDRLRQDCDFYLRGKMLKEYRRNPAKFIEECMNIRLLQYQREFINRIIKEEQYENLH